MFGLFKSKSDTAKVIDKVWMYRQGKFNACRDMAALNPSIAFVAFFEETQRELQAVLQGVHVLLASEVSVESVRDRMIVFVEHHPVIAEEQTIFKKLNLKEVNVLSGLDEPLFMTFNGAKTIELMKRMGMHEHEAIGHSMISNSIKRAQKKITEVHKSNIPASSQAKWFELNPARRR
ncbi:hypothetical protein [Pseudochryseolinea flava]|uniref:Uncharacterized protein n=1 Tax=Pseudochryseolinea flava TaxID=2059302 RepID=A0A364XWJ8_9BACT|nr:hypothetical protein [Pseudochryseolinea flava]RAV98528.1 hypothetical protein DQQ10_23715 [Pseudochryseolinea flava]